MASFLVAVLILSIPEVVMPASGPAGIYGIVEKVVFEPNEQAPERIQIWGAFAYVGGLTQTELGFADVKKGYLYFVDPVRSEIIRKEWRDLKAIAGTGQAIGFGNWTYTGALPTQPGDRAPHGFYLPGGYVIDLRVRPASEPPASPASYAVNAGIIKLSSEGSHSEIVKLLKDALKQ
jgi:hypothetical protein